MGRVHIVGAGPVGLFVAALFQSVDGQLVRLYGRRDSCDRDLLERVGDTDGLLAKLHVF